MHGLYRAEILDKTINLASAILNCTLFVRQYSILNYKWGVIFYTKGETKQEIHVRIQTIGVETMREENLSVNETMRRFETNDYGIIERWERIYLENIAVITLTYRQTSRNLLY